GSKDKMRAVRTKREVVARRKSVRCWVRIPITRRHIARCAGFVAVETHHEQVLALVLDVFVPVAKKESGKVLGPDRVLCVFFGPLLVGRIAFGERFARILGPNSGGEGDLLTVARPDGSVGAAADGRQLPRLAAVEVNDPELARAAAVGFEEDALAVGAPTRMTVALRSRGELFRFDGLAWLGGCQPQILGDAVGFEIDYALNVDHPLAVGADLRIGNALEAE